MENHPVATALATIIVSREPQRLVAALTETTRLRALLPRGLIQAHGRMDVAACFHDFFADFDTVQLIDYERFPMSTSLRHPALDAWGDYDRDDPYPLFAKVRAAGPVHPVRLAAGHPAWLVVGYERGPSGAV